MSATDLMNDLGILYARTETDDGRGGKLISYEPQPGPNPAVPTDPWPVQVSEPSAADKIAADNPVSRIDGRLYLPVDCPVRRRDRIVIVGRPVGSDTWTVESIVRPSRNPHVKAFCTQDQDEGVGA